MTPKRYYFLIASFSALAGGALFVNYIGLDTAKNYIIPSKSTEIEPSTTLPGTTKRLNFQNINDRVFLLDSFRSIQSGDLYIQTEAEVHNSSEISQMNCVLCKNKYSFFDDPNECTILDIESVHHNQDSVKPKFRIITFLKCKVPSHINIKDYPLATLKISEDYGHLFPINDIDKNKVARNSTFITMCAGPQYGKFKKAVNLAEWIEFHHQMGISKFQIYVTDKDSISPEYHDMLKKYVDKGLVDLIYWENLSKTYYNTQDGLLNHCVWNNKANSDLVAFNDIDEFFVPANNSYDNWNEVFKPYLENVNNSQIRFRNWFYDATCPDQKENSDLLLSSVFIRAKEPTSSEARTKCILRPERILLAGIHKTLEFMPEHEKNNYTTVVIPPEEGYMAHFGEKIKTPECDLKKANNSEVNYDLKKYGELIEGRVKEAKELINV